MKLLNIIIIVACLEKLLQHSLTALFFVIEVPGIGTPDIGSTFIIDNYTMAFLNVVVFLLFAIGLSGFTREKQWGSYLIIAMAIADIVLEFVFHYLFFITVSVIVSAILTIALLEYLRKDPRSNPAKPCTDE